MGRAEGEEGPLPAPAASCPPLAAFPPSPPPPTPHPQGRRRGQRGRTRSREGSAAVGGRGGDGVPKGTLTPQTATPRPGNGVTAIEHRCAQVRP